jgi:RHS repeat-associated protein
MPTDRFFTNQRLESNIGLYDYRARFYDPWVGSFIQPDSIVPDPFEPAAWNRYGYVYGNPTNYTDPTGHIVCGTEDSPCPEPITIFDTSNWPNWGENLAWWVCLPIGCSVENNSVRTPTLAEQASTFGLDYLNPMGFAAVGAGRIGKNILRKLLDEAPGNLPRSVAIRRDQTIQALSEIINPYLSRIRKISGEDSLIGFRGSLARGRVGNRNKRTFGTPINFDDFDVDAFIISDDLVAVYGNKRWGNDIPELKPIQDEIRVALGELPEFQGLRPGKDGFSFRIFTKEEVLRRFRGEEIYFIRD